MAGCVVDTLADSANQKITGSLTLVRLVGYSVPIEKAFKAALTQAMLGNRNLKAQNAITQAICGKQKRKAKTTIKSFTNGIVINGVLIEVLQGDITCESTELIANPTDEDLKLTGNLSKALITKCGSSVVEECKAIGTLKDIAITSAGTGSLRCDQIIHIRSPGDINECQTLIRALLSTIATKRFRSIAIPPIGVSHGIPLQQVSGCITDEVASAARRKNLGLLRHIRLIGFNQTEKGAFEEALKLSFAEGSALNTEKNVRSITEASAKNVAPNLPVTWTPMPITRSWSQILMQQSDADYAEALKLFTLSLKAPKIFRIQNPTFYMQYQLEKMEMEKQYAGKWPFRVGIDRHLYHGTEVCRAEDLRKRIRSKLLREARGVFRTRIIFRARHELLGSVFKVIFFWRKVCAPMPNEMIIYQVFVCSCR